MTFACGVSYPKTTKRRNLSAAQSFARVWRATAELRVSEILADPSTATTIGAPEHAAGVAPNAGENENLATLQYGPAANRVGSVSVVAVGLVLSAKKPAPSRQKAMRLMSLPIFQSARPQEEIGAAAAVFRNATIFEIDNVRCSQIH